MYEYKVLKFSNTSMVGGNVNEENIEEENNKLGREGWELAFTDRLDASQGATSNYLMIFKRSKG